MLLQFWQYNYVGHGFGLEIVGGKTIGDRAGGEVGAFVTAIYRGSVADQLHGELQEGKKYGTKGIS